MQYRVIGYYIVGHRDLTSVRVNLMSVDRRRSTNIDSVIHLTQLRMCLFHDKVSKATTLYHMTPHWYGQLSRCSYNFLFGFSLLTVFDLIAQKKLCAASNLPTCLLFMAQWVSCLNLILDSFQPTRCGSDGGYAAAARVQAKAAVPPAACRDMAMVGILLLPGPWSTRQLR